MNKELADVLHDSKTDILNIWEQKVRDILPAARVESKISLRDSIPQFLDDLALVFSKSVKAAKNDLVRFAHKHGAERANLSQYSIEDALAEFNILRKVIFNVVENKVHLSSRDRDIINDAIHLGMTKAGAEFAKYQFENIQNEKKRLQLITDIQPILIGQVDVNLKYTFVNRAYQDWFNRPLEEIVGKSAKEVMGEEAFKQAEPYFKRALQGEKVIFERLMNYRNGAKRYVHSTYSPGFDSKGQVNSIYISVADRTEQHDNLSAYKKSEKEYRELANVLKKEQLLRDKFISALSHDLRTPLTAASLSGQLISKKTKDESILNLAQKVSVNLKRVEKMIEDLLDANRLRAGKKIVPLIEEFNVCTLVKETVKDLEMIYGDRFVIDCPEILTVNLSPAGVRRVIENLCSNAIKYGEPSSPISINLKENHPGFELSVHNFGNPINKKDTSNLFKQFERASEDEASGKQGWGIGLSIVQGIVEGHGGKIIIDSDDRGTIFRILWPLDSRKFIQQQSLH